MSQTYLVILSNISFGFSSAMPIHIIVIVIVVVVVVFVASDSTGKNINSHKPSLGHSHKLISWFLVFAFFFFPSWLLNQATTPLLTSPVCLCVPLWRIYRKYWFPLFVIWYTHYFIGISCWLAFNLRYWPKLSITPSSSICPATIKHQATVENFNSLFGRKNETLNGSYLTKIIFQPLAPLLDIMPVLSKSAKLAEINEEKWKNNDVVKTYLIYISLIS